MSQLHVPGNNNQFPVGGPGLLGQNLGQNKWDPRVNSPVTMAVMKALQVCPDGCDPSTILQAVPPPGMIGPGMVLPYARCIRCLTFWEVGIPDGKVKNIRWGYDSRHRAGLAAKPTPAP